MSDLFGKNLREARKAKGLTTTECAKHFGISQPAWNFYELGTREPKLDLLIQICKYLEVNPNILLGFDDTDCMPRSSPASATVNLELLKETATQLAVESAALSRTAKKLKAML